MYVGILDGKIWDVCSRLEHKRDDSIPEKEYLDLPMGNWVVGDTWDFEKEDSLKDSPKRFEEKPKTELELKIENIEARLKILEGKKS